MSLPFTQPNYFDSSEAGAPTLNNVAGSLLEVLRACLKNGFNTKTVTSIVVASGVATATAASHGYLSTYGKLLLIEGSTEPLLNGRKQPLSVATNTFTYAAPGVADGTYTGTISAKRAPLGWTEPYTDTNKAIFARSAPEASAQMLRVLDTAAAPASAIAARVFMVEAATGIDTYTGQGPTQVQLADGLAWFKGANTATAKRWAVAGNDRFLYLITESGSNTARNQVGWFGDAQSFKSADAYCGVIGGSNGVSEVTSVSATPIYCRTLIAAVSTSTFYIARLSGQTGGAVRAQLVGFIDNTSLGAVGPAPLGPVDGGFVLQKPQLFIEEGGINPVRGIVPGLAAPMAKNPYTTLQIVGGFTGDNSTYLTVHTLASSDGSCFLIDLTGPWY